VRGLFVTGGFWTDEVEREEAPGDKPGVVGDSAEVTEAERPRPGAVIGIGREGGVEGEAIR
jgi:hypothetical protein